MYLIISLLLALLLSLGLTDQIKRNPAVFYLLSVILMVGFSLYYQFGLPDVLPEWVTTYIVSPFKRGSFSTALFILVMYTGLLNPKWQITKKLYKIRGNISIIGCIITLGHNFVYGKKNFPLLFFHISEMKPTRIAATILTLFMIAMMIPLMITSFDSVRKKMKFQTWKKVQALAYPFFSLIYIHIMVLFIPKADKKLLDIILYTIIFVGYAILRLRKAANAKQNPRCNAA